VRYWFDQKTLITQLQSGAELGRIRAEKPGLNLELLCRLPKALQQGHSPANASE
jgi:hypothetical protein